MGLHLRPENCQYRSCSVLEHLPIVEKAALLNGAVFGSSLAALPLLGGGLHLYHTKFISARVAHGLRVIPQASEWALARVRDQTEDSAMSMICKIS